MEKEKIENCPFCGGSDLLEFANHRGEFVGCNTCGIDTPRNIWNSRPTREKESAWIPVDQKEALKNILREGSKTEDFPANEKDVEEVSTTLLELMEKLGLKLFGGK